MYKKTRGYYVAPKAPQALIKPYDFSPKAQQEHDKEYGECRKVEKAYAKRLAKYRNPGSLPEAQDVCNRVCAALFIARNPHVYIVPCHSMVAGYCAGKDIVIQSNFISLRVLLHELAHYIVFRERLRGRHHDDFLWVLEMIYECFFNLYQI